MRAPAPKWVVGSAFWLGGALGHGNYLGLVAEVDAVGVDVGGGFDVFAAEVLAAGALVAELLVLVST